jgi:hypothetical protein
MEQGRTAKKKPAEKNTAFNFKNSFLAASQNADTVYYSNNCKNKRSEKTKKSVKDINDEVADKSGFSKHTDNKKNTDSKNYYSHNLLMVAAFFLNFYFTLSFSVAILRLVVRPLTDSTVRRTAVLQRNIF